VEDLAGAGLFERFGLLLQGLADGGHTGGLVRSRNRFARPRGSGPACVPPGRTAPPLNPNKPVDMERIRIDLNGPPQTMLVTLYAKALGADAPRS
jgi:hypothetical protein